MAQRTGSAPLLRNVNSLFKRTTVFLLFLWCPAVISADTTVGGIISSDTTWTTAGSPYVVTSNITIQGTDGPDGITTLTIDPGVIVKFNSTRQLNIGASSGNPGALAAIGNAGAPIVFTSNQANPSAGDWYGIRFQNTTADTDTVLENCTVQYAGYGNQGSVYINNAAPTIRATSFENSSNYDLYYSGTVGGTVTDCTLHSGTYLLATSTAIFSGNTFYYNSSYPFKAYADNVHSLVNGNIFYDLTSSSYLEVTSGNVTKDATWTSAIPYLIQSNLTVQGADGPDAITTLTIEPGAIVKFGSGRQLIIGASSGNPGAIVAQGSVSQPIVFTSSQASPSPGNWYGIRFNNTTADSATVLDHCTIQYAGGGSQAGLYIYQASPTVRHTTVSNSAYYGAYIYAGSPVIEDSQFSGSGYWDLFYSGSVGGSVSNSTIRNGISLLTTGAVNFSGNIVHYNNSYPIKTYADYVGALVNGCTFSNVDSSSRLEVSGGTISRDATWTSALPYAVITNITIQGADGDDGVTTLMLSPGATLKFSANQQLNVGAASGNPGALTAQGTAAQPVVFTSSQANPAPGNWNGIKFNNTTADALTILDHCSVQYAGYGNQGALYFYQSAPTIRNTAVSHSSSHGAYISTSTPSIENCDFSANANYDLYYTGTIGGSVSGTIINDGIYLLATGSVAFSGNTLHYDNAHPVKLFADQVGALVGGSTITGTDSGSSIEVSAGTISHDAIWTADVPYAITGNITVQGTDGADGITSLTILPGASLRFNQNLYMNIGATTGNPAALIARGTAAQPITVTSNLATPAPGNWYGLRFYDTASDASSVLDFCIVQYAGYGNQGAVYLYNAKPDIRNCTLRNNQDRALYLNGAGCNGADINSNTFTSNVYGIYLYGNAQPTIQFNNFTGNSSYGLYNGSSLAVIAEYNWWGDAAGPNQSGDKTYGNVDSDPWLGQINEISGGTTVTVPDVTGLTQAEAQLQLTASGLRVGTITDGYSESIAPGRVISQIPAATSSVEAGSAVDLLISLGPTPPPIVNITASPSAIIQGQTATLSWTSNHAATISIDNGVGTVAAAGTQVVSPNQTTTYTITASGPGGTATASATITVHVPPTASITANPQTIQVGQSATITWSSSHAQSADINQGIGPVALNGSMAISPAETTEYTLTATGPGGTATASVTITVNYPVPTLTFTATPEIIPPDQSATLSWSTSHAETCTIDQGIGSVPLSGSIVVAPGASTTYTLTAQGRGGTATATVTLTIPENPPTVSASADRTSLLLGQSARLTWTTTHAERCVIEPNIGDVDLNGSLSVSPVETTKYFITAYGSGISATAEVQVSVGMPSLNIINTIAGTGAEDYAGDGGPAVTAQMIRPNDIAVDLYGNLYIADSANCRIRKVDPRGIITTIAGNGTYGYSGDGGPATQAQISPYRIAADSGGNIYFYQSSTTGNGIRKVDIGGTITTVSSMSAGAMVMDSGDYLYFAAGYQVRKIAPDGTVTVVAGNGSSGYNGDGGPAIAARLNYPEDLAVDRDGNLYIVDLSTDRVRKVDTVGIITTVAGGGTSVDEGISATSAKLVDLESIAVDPLGNLYILEGSSPGGKIIRKVDRNGIISTVSGKDITVPTKSIGDSGPVEVARLEYARKIRIDQSGNWYVAGHSRDVTSVEDRSCIRKVAPPSVFPVLITAPLDGLVSFDPQIEISGLVHPGAQVRANGIQASVVEDTFRVTVPLSQGLNRILAEVSVNGEITGYDAVSVFYLPEFYGIIDAAVDLYSPDALQVFDCPTGSINLSLQSVTADADGNIYFPFCNRIFRVSSNGVVQAVAGSGIQGYSGDGGLALEAKLNNPAGIAVVANGSIYIADQGNHRVRKVEANGIIVTVAGTGLTQWNGASGPGLELNLSSPRDVILEPSGNLYIADTMHYRVLELHPDGFCEFVTGQYQWFSETVVTRGEFIKPYGLGIDANGSLYIADTGNHVVWRMDGGVRTRVAGQWCFDCDGSFTEDGGPATEAWLKKPSDVAVGSEGAIYFTEMGNNRVRRVGANGTLHTLIGDGTSANSGDGGPGQLAQINYPASIAMHTDGTIYTAANGGRIGRIRPPRPATISGRVIDANTSTPLTGAAVNAEWMSVANSVSTDANGTFAFTDIEAFEGPVKIMVQAPGYITHSQGCDVSQGAAPFQELRLYPKPSLTLNLASPAENLLIHTSSVVAAGSASHPARVTVNGLETLDAGMSFSKSVPVVDGQNTINLLARDAYNQTALVQRRFNGTYLEPTTELQVSATEILRGETAVLSWDTANAANVRIEPGIGAVNPVGSMTISPNQTITYTLTAENPPHTATSSVTVAVTQLEPVRLSIAPATINLGQSATLTWSCRDDHAETVNIEPAIGAVAPIGSMQVSPRGTTTYTITASGPGGTAIAAATVTVNLIPPSVYLTADPSTILYGARTTLSWSTFNADTVTLTGYAGSQSASGSKYVTLYNTTTYSLTATGPGGTTTKSMTVTVIPAPQVTFSANPFKIALGDSSTLSWSVTSADTVSIDNGIGSVPHSGSMTITPSNSISYYLSAIGPGGTTTRAAGVTIVPLPAITFNVNPAVIHPGEKARLSWYVLYGDSWAVSPDIGTIYSSGSRDITPSQTTIYTLTSSGIGGTATAAVPVRVVGLPKAALTADPLIINPDQTATLRWTTTDVDSCVLTPGIGNVLPSGQLEVSPAQSTLYTLAATGPLEETETYVRVYVRGDMGYGDPTPAEQAHIEAINRARANPAAEAARLSIDLNEGLAAGTIGTDALQPLACSARLLEAARLHAQDMVDRQYIAHNSLDGRTPSDRIQAAGFTFTLTGENISYLSDAEPLEEVAAALTCHDNLFIDEAVEGRGHRLNLVKPEYKEVGIGLSRGAFETSPYAALLTCDFGTSAEETRSYLLGVIYDDLDGDGLYTAGEGLGDVEVSIQETGELTISASAGGYRIPLAPGDYTLTADLPDGRHFTRPVTMADRNVKLDLSLVPLPIVEFAVDPLLFDVGEAITLTWNVTGAQSCQITPEPGTVALSGSEVVFPTANTTYTLSATGAGGTVSRSIAVKQYPPAVTFSVAPQTISQGQSATLSWSTLGATGCSIDQGIGPVPLEGSLEVSPSAATTYTLTAVGEGGTTTRSVTVWFDGQAPTIVEVIPANGGIVHVQNGKVTVTVTAADDDAGFCDADLLDSQGNDLSNLLTIDDNTISWSADTAGGSVRFTLIVYDCAGNSAQVPIDCTAVAVPADVDYGLDENAATDFAGGGVRMTNGNMVEARSDLSFSTPNGLGLRFDAFYNSRSTEGTALGYGWSHTYSVKLDRGTIIGGQNCLRILDASARARYFAGTSPHAGLLGEKSHVTYDGGYYIWYRLDGTRYGFNGDGQLIWMDDAVGNRLQLAYSEGRLYTVNDLASGRILTMNYSGARLASISGPVTQAIPGGIWVTFSQDAQENLSTVSYADGSGITYSYNDPLDSHNLTRKQNSLGHLLGEWRYDGQDRATYSRPPDDSGVALDYPAADRVTVTDPYGVVRSYRLRQILGHNKVIELLQGPAAAPYNQTPGLRWIYDDRLNLTQVELAGGIPGSIANTIHRLEEFDERGNPATLIQAWNTPEERTISFTYHPTLNTVLTRSEASVLDDGQEKETIYDYDDPAAAGDDPNLPNQSPTRLLRRIIEKGYTRSAGGSLEAYTHVTAFTYSAKGQTLAVDGPLDGTQDTVTYRYNETIGDLLGITRPLVGETLYSDYDAAGQAGTITDVNQVATSMTYDGRGRVVETEQQASGGRTRHVYDRGLLEQVEDADGITRTYEYDPQYDRLASMTDHQGYTIVYTYDTQGNRIGEYRRDPANPSAYTSRRWSYQHPDVPGLLYRAYSPNPAGGQDVFSEYRYDRAGNTYSATDPKGAVTRYNYDAMNRLIEIIQPGGGITAMDYDSHGNLISVTDAEGHQTRYAYDDLDRLVTEISPDTGTTTYAYDEAGNLVQSLDSRGLWITYTPDLLARTRRIDYPAISGQAAYSVVFDYDGGAFGKGRLTAMSDASGTTAWDYSRFDDEGVLTKTATISGHGYTVEKTQTRAGRITQLVYPSGRTVDYARSECTCSISGVSTRFGADNRILLSDLHYRPFGPPAAMDIGGSGAPNVDNRYDGAGRLTAANPGTPHERRYDFDANGNHVNINLPASPWQSELFSYDKHNRITGAVGGYGMIDFIYDRIGNRLTHLENGAARRFHYTEGTSRIERIDGPGEEVAFAYDGHGNTTAAGGRTYTYDQANRLVQVAENSLIKAEYVYNGLGQRVIKRVNGVSTYYHYDLDGHMIAETAPGASFNEGKEYIYKGNGLLALAELGTGMIFTYHTNYLGAVQQLTDNNGTVVWEAVYKPFGEAVVNAGSIVTSNWRLPGQYFDEETGLNYNWHRYYDPALGRYLAPDPIGLEGGINLYAYVQNDPVNLIDPEGLSPAGWVIKLTKTGFQKLSSLGSSAAARQARRQGQNVLAPDRQAAKAVERGAFGGAEDVLRHKGHDLADGAKGMPHFQTPGKPGHTFWGGVVGFLSLFDPTDSISGELAGPEYDMIPLPDYDSPCK